MGNLPSLSVACLRLGLLIGPLFLAELGEYGGLSSMALGLVLVGGVLHESHKLRKANE